MKINKIEEIAEFDLYDISVDDDHCFELDSGIIAHNSMYASNVMSGGQGPMLSADTVFIVTKSQNKEGTELAGYNFNISVEKSRFVREKSKFPITVNFNSGIEKYSAILPWAVEYGIVKKPSNGWYQLVDMTTGEMLGTKIREAATGTDEFLGVVCKDEGFKAFVKNKFAIGQSETPSDDEIDSVMEVQ